MAHAFIKFPSSFFALVVLTICIKINAKELTDEQKETIFAEVKACVKDTGLSDDEFEIIVAKKELPTSEEGKCFTKCLMEKMDYFEEGGKINVISMQAALEENMDKETDINTTKNIIQLCSDSVTPEDNCEYAYAISKCIYNKMKEAGITGA